MTHATTGSAGARASTTTQTGHWDQRSTTSRITRMSSSNDDVWAVCSACRRDIGFGAVHWVCSVSTCNRNRTRLVFCSVACWDSHLSTLRHREAWAVEELAPKRGDRALDEPAPARPSPSPAPAPLAAAPPRPQPVAAAPAPSARPPASALAGSVTAHAGGPALSNDYAHDDMLIVVSKLKKYIRDRSGMNTSDSVADMLGDHVRSVCDEAIRNAARDGRKTVLDRDVPRARR